MDTVPADLKGSATVSRLRRLGRGDRRRIALAAAVLFTLATAVIGSIASASPSDAQTTASAPVSERAAGFAVSPPARELEPSSDSAQPLHQAPARINPLAGDPGGGARGTRGRGDVAPDPLAGASTAAGRTPAPGLTFEGADNGCGCLPPDTVGDVGPNRYVQMVNSTEVTVFNKAGTILDSFDLGSLWPVSDACATSIGDPVVRYDEQADRWLLSQFYDNGITTGLCFAISKTASPTGAYFLYRFVTPDFPDYFKVGVWPNGYYVSTNESTYAAYAFNRGKMLAGNPTANFIRFAGQTNFLMPADVDGPTLPAGGGLFFTFKDNSFHGGADRIELFRLNPNYATPASSTFTLIKTLPVTPFTYTVCGFFVLNCIQQPGTAAGLDPVSEWPMQRLAYRGFAGHEALVGNFTVRAHAPNATSAGAGIRWFELRNTGSGWSLFQEGTQDSNAIDRWMGSIAIDKAGNIGLGYSASSEALSPSIRYATRAPGDPAGTLQAEQTLQAGGGSQTSTFNRWGDYSAISVDPSDDCTFWYTNEYYPSTSQSSWHTRIGNFVVPGCGAPAPAFSANPPSINFGNQAVGTNSPLQTVTVTNTGTANLTISSVALATGNTGDFGTQNDSCTGATLTPSGTCTIQARFSPTATGARSTKLRFTDNASGSPHDVALSGTGTAPGFSVSPSSINFGNQNVGASSPFQTLTVTNTGTANLSITAVALAGGNPGDFGTQGNTCTGATLTPNGTCTIQARFSPTATGARSTALRFTDNASGSPHDVALSGTGTAATPPPPPPSNQFTIGGLTRNKKKGTATLTVQVPGPGVIALGGPGVKPQRPIARLRGGASAKPVAGAGSVELTIKAVGAKKRKLKRTGKVKVKTQITYTPTGGTPATQSKSVKLKRKLP
jgi:ASPM-SPD-2-Hydin domain-containing protein